MLVTHDLNDEKNQTTETKTCPIDKLSTTNPTQTGLGLNLGLCGTNHVSYFTDKYITCGQDILWILCPCCSSGTHGSLGPELPPQCLLDLSTLCHSRTCHVVSSEPQTPSGHPLAFSPQSQSCWHMKHMSCQISKLQEEPLKLQLHSRRQINEASFCLIQKFGWDGKSWKAN